MHDAVAGRRAVSESDDRTAMIGLLIIAAVMVVLTLATVPATRAAGDYGYVALALTAGMLALLATRIAERAPTAHAQADATRGVLAVLRWLTAVPVAFSRRRQRHSCVRIVVNRLWPAVFRGGR